MLKCVRKYDGKNWISKFWGAGVVVVVVVVVVGGEAQ